MPDKVLCFDVDLAGVVLCHPPTYVNKVLLGSATGGWAGTCARGSACTPTRRSRAAPASRTSRRRARWTSWPSRAARAGSSSGRAEDAVLFELDHGAAAAACCFCRGGEPRGAGDARPPVLVAAGGDQLRVWDPETRALLHVEKRAAASRRPRRRPRRGPTGADAVVVTSVGADASSGRWTRRTARRGSAGGATGSAARPRWCAGTARPRAAARSRARPATRTGAAAARRRAPGPEPAVPARRARPAERRASQRGAADARAKRLRLADPKALRLPPVTCVAAGDAKDGSFPNVVTCHRGERVARVWSLAERRLADHCLTQPHWGGRGRDDPGQVARRDSATACDLSACGNFALIGHEDGYVRKYNVQSGEARGTYPASLEAAPARRGPRRVGRGAPARWPGRRAPSRGSRARARRSRSGTTARTRGRPGPPARAPSRGARAAAEAPGRRRGRPLRRRERLVRVVAAATRSSGGPSRTTGRGGPARRRGVRGHGLSRARPTSWPGSDGGAVLVLDARPPDAGGGRVLRRLGTHAGRAARDLSWSATRQSPARSAGGAHSTGGTSRPARASTAWRSPRRPPPSRRRRPASSPRRRT